jgi:ATP/maltotriose-dependent transcriptional regulator MalT
MYAKEYQRRLESKSGAASMASRSNRVRSEAFRGLAQLALARGDVDQAVSYLSQCIALSEAHGESWERASALCTWAILAWGQRNGAEATRLAHQSLQLCARFPDRLGIPQCLEVLFSTWPPRCVGKRRSLRRSHGC